MIRIVVLLIAVVFAGCISGSKSKLVLLKQEGNYEIKLKSSCKKSAFDSIATNAEYKLNLKETLSNELKSAKIKTIKKEEKSSYRIKRTQFIVTERCGAKTSSGKPFIGMQYILTIENLKTKDTLNFSQDTIYVSSDNLNTLVPKKIDLNHYISPLIKKTITQLKRAFK